MRVLKQVVSLANIAKPGSSSIGLQACGIGYNIRSLVVFVVVSSQLKGVHW